MSRTSTNRRTPASLAGIVVLVVLALPLGGCTTYHVLRYGDQPPSEAQMEEMRSGVPRERVEAILGKPIAERQNLATYEFNTRKRPPLWAGIPLGMTFDFLTMGMAAMNWAEINRSYKAQKGTLTVAYSPGGKALPSDYEAAKSAFASWLDGADRGKEMDALCQAANGGVAPAQRMQALRHRYGLYGASVDPVASYMWLRLAAHGGDALAARLVLRWAAEMPVEDVAGAEEAFRSWQPESCPD